MPPAPVTSVPPLASALAVSEPSPEDRLAGLLIGTALGDSLGLPREGISRRRNRKLFRGAPQQRLLGRWGLLSDDTEQTALLAQALLRTDTPDKLVRVFAWRLRWYLLRLPAAVGYATLRSTAKMWLGFGPERSGVYSAGNAPAMRAAVLGARLAVLGVPVRDLRAWVTPYVTLTHTDPKAIDAAFTVALAAYLTMQSQTGTAVEFLAQLRAHAEDPEWEQRLAALEPGLLAQQPAADWLDNQGLTTVTGYIYETVPASLYCWLVHQYDAQAALTAALDIGGDVDTVAAITGALVGTQVGGSELPQQWTRSMVDWPLSVTQLRRLAHALAVPQTVAWRWTDRLRAFASGFASLLRNLLFLVVVLLWVLRRALPPY